MPKTEPQTTDATTTASDVPKTAPSRWVMFATPDAMPVSSGSTAPRIAVGIVGSVIEMPTPAMNRASTSCA